MATTTNFGWETPDDTDLVKDGAAAIRTVANSIDTSFVDLKGGTTGQILSKASNTDLDYAWITNDVGDITAVTAGTGITGGGTSGAVTITNDMATKIDAKGDLIVGTGADTYDRLAVGTNGHVLTADSTASTGTKWASVATTKNFSLLGTGNCSGAGSQTVTVSGISGIDQLYIMFNGVSSASASSTITLRFNGDTSTNYDQYTFYLTANTSWAASNMDATSNLSNDRFPIAVTGINSASGVWGHAIISGCNTAGKKMISSFASGDTNTSGNRGYWAGGVWNNTATITSVSVVSTTGNLDLGTFLVFGAA